MSEAHNISSFNQRHLSVSELAAFWNVSEDTIRRLFLTEPGVIVLHRPRRRTRTYRTLRIPEHVAQRVYERLGNGGLRGNV